MPDKILRSPSQTKDAIARKFQHVKEASTRLSERIQLFESWIAKLPGRVETMYCGASPDESPADNGLLCLKLQRSGKSWMIGYGLSTHDSLNNDDSENAVGDWKPLNEAPVKYKLAAIAMFPDFLESIVKSQDKLAEDINRACSEFDAFAAELGIQGKEADHG